MKAFLVVILLGLFSTTAAQAGKHPATLGELMYSNSAKSVSKHEGHTNKKVTTKRHKQRVAQPYGKSGLGGRPRKWCGWWVRTLFGGGPEYNVAANWAKRGIATSPTVGAVVVWRHHVGIITGKSSDGQWIVKSGNDGGRVRERPRSVAKAIAFRIVG
jgi:hypothetical protein